MVNDVTLFRPDGNKSRDTLDVSNVPIGGVGIDFDLPRPVAPQQQQQPPPPEFVPPPPPQPKPTMMMPPRPQPQHPPQPEELNDFANPNKVEDSPEIDVEESPMMDENFGNEYDNEYDEYEQQQYQQPPPMMQQAPPQVQPLPPFETLEDERADLMYKLQRAARSGISVRTFGWNADIREIRAEVGRAKAEQEVDASIAFQRQILMTICTGMEFANKRFAYLDLELDGWSENMMDDIGKFDTVFEKLHKKHAGRMNIPPELQLVFMIGGSALTWHLVAKSRKTRTLEEERAEWKKNKKRRRRKKYESEDSDSDESERSKLRKKYSKPAKSAKKEMRGPGFDVGGMMGGLGGGLGSLGGFGGMMMPPMMPQVPVPDLAPRFTRPPQQKQIEEVQGDDDIKSDDESERLSDIPSEGLDDVPSNFGSPEETSPVDENDARVITLEEEKPKRRGRAGKKNETKKVVII